ncbi:hemerythrin domain-containing protein [Salegentibacter chungangensis]|uniref:Hemerythrin domain-containing protein n=1 Tax=Salegentibacter chungangensis TaxID=1335724 RepID=A0ABW3NRR4_9FLAO
MKHQPIKRHEALKPLSREHHQGLLLCMKIRRGIEAGIEPERIKKYTNWFWINHLVPHFREEEAYIFPILEKEDELFIRVMAEHKNLKALFEEKSPVDQNHLSQLADELEKHIRFEERILFNKIQEKANKEELEKIESLLNANVNDCGTWDDEFWL